ncbi:hypothetical protein [Christiangramia sp.]|uniref:hypothetical protein n=1 Tax=Christiangramia sp. TaxID=1931228 RepID=UPI00261F2C8B|nr:hypothetical protein [Christiangramia sp.]
MKLTITHYRGIEALLLLSAILFAYFSEGMWVNFFAGLFSGAGVLLMIKGSLKPGKN